MEVAFGTGASSLVTLCGALSTVFRELKEQGLPSNASLRGLQTAEDICINVLRGLSIPIEKLTEDFQSTLGYQQHQRAHDATCGSNNAKEDFQQGPNPHSHQTITVPLLKTLAAGLQHNSASCRNTTTTEVWEKRSTQRIEELTDRHPELSLPATLAVQAVAALLVPCERRKGSRNSDVLPDLARVRTRLVVGPASVASFVAPGAVVVEVPPWQRAAVEDAFIKRRCACGPQSGEKRG